jgi:2-iminobutanoate/2-iminopropanoate deaminase
MPRGCGLTAGIARFVAFGADDDHLAQCETVYHMTRKTIQRHFGFLVMGALCSLPCAFAQNHAIDFKPGAPFSDGYVAGNTLYVAGQQGPDGPGKFGDISQQTTKAIAAIERVIKKAGFQMTDIVSVTVYITDLNDVPKMNEAYKKLMPDPKPARATVQVAGLIGGAKIEISAIAVKH